MTQFKTCALALVASFGVAAASAGEISDNVVRVGVLNDISGDRKSVV